MGLTLTAPSAFAQASNAADVPITAYGDLPKVRDAALSPSGDLVAFYASIEDQPKIIIVDSDAKPKRVLNAGDMKVRSFQFVGEDTLLLYHSKTVDVNGFAADQYELTQAIFVPVAPDGKITTAFGNNRELGNSVHGSHGVRRTPSGWMVFLGALENMRAGDGQYYFNHGRPALYSVEVPSGKERRVAASPPEKALRDWLLDRDGKVSATFDIAKSTGKWTIRNGEGQVIAKGQNPGGDAGLVGVGKDGTTVIYYARDEQTGDSDWLEIPLAGGEARPFLPDVDVKRLYWDRETGHFLGYLEDSAEEKVVFHDPAMQARVAAVRKAFSGLDVRLIEWTADFGKVIAHTTGKGDSGTWFTVDLETKRANALGYDYPLIPPDKVGPVSTVKYTAQDGLEMDGILTLPPGREAKNLPVVMLPHGGPHAHDTESFDWWAQAFASRGYAVFQPNFRGSTGRGDAFEQAGYGQWGRKMQTDISDGLAKLVADGTVDPKRACIVGASYGGYAALAGVTLQQGLYRCAVSVAGVSDIGYLYRIDNRESGGLKLLKKSLLEELGPRDGWKEVSPKEQADKADAPILLIHGKDDTVVPIEQSERMADALKDADKAYQFVTLPGEDHWLSNAETRKRMLAEALTFVQSHNPAD